MSFLCKSKIIKKLYLYFFFLLFFIPQFDILTVGAQIFGLLLSLSFFYYFNINLTIPLYIQIKKYRTKKLIKSLKKVDNVQNSLKQNLNIYITKYKYFLVN